MKSFNLYEFAGLLVPGAIFVTTSILAIIFLFHLDLKKVPLNIELTGLSFFLILSFVAGELIQTISNYFQKIWWDHWNMKPTNWLLDSSISENRFFKTLCYVLFFKINTQEIKLTPIQMKRLLKNIRNYCGENKYKTFPKTKKGIERKKPDWKMLIYEIEVILKNNQYKEEIAKNIGHYNFFKGIIICFLLFEFVAILSFVINYIMLLITMITPYHIFNFKDFISSISFILLCHTILIVSFRGMHRFAISYTRDLFLQFINMKENAGR